MESDLSDSQMVLLGLFRFDLGATPATAAQILGMPVEVVLEMIDDLQRFGLIERTSEH